jgi:hypothetical protein
MDLRETGLDWSGSGQGPVNSSFEHGSEHSISIKCCVIVVQLHTWRLFKKDTGSM